MDELVQVVDDVHLLTAGWFQAHLFEVNCWRSYGVKRGNLNEWVKKCQILIVTYSRTYYAQFKFKELKDGF